MENSAKQDNKSPSALHSHDNFPDQEQPMAKKQKIEPSIKQESSTASMDTTLESCIIPECDEELEPVRLIEHLKEFHKIEATSGKGKEEKKHNDSDSSLVYHEESRSVINSKKKKNGSSEEDEDQQIDQQLFEKIFKKIFSMENTTKEIEIIYKMFLQKVLVNSYNECKRLYEEEKLGNNTDKIPQHIEQAFKAVEKEYNDKYDSVSAKYLTSHSKESINYQIKLQLMMGYLDNLEQLAKFEEKYKLRVKQYDNGDDDNNEEKYKSQYEKLQRKLLWSDEVSQLLQKDLKLLTQQHEDLFIKKENLLDANLKVELGR